MFNIKSEKKIMLNRAGDTGGDFLIFEVRVAYKIIFVLPKFCLMTLLGTPSLHIIDKTILKCM